MMCQPIAINPCALQKTDCVVPKMTHHYLLLWRRIYKKRGIALSVILATPNIKTSKQIPVCRVGKSENVATVIFPRKEKCNDSS